MAELYELPPTLQGDEAAQLRQLWSYLYQVSIQLNAASARAEEKSQENIKKATAAAGETTQKTGDGLKALIVKTAEIIHHEMDQIRTTLQSQYSALSEEFGELQENLTNTITATAEGVVQNFNYSQIIDGLQAYTSGDTTKYRTDISAYIKTGTIGQENGQPIFGVAIGKDIVDENGNVIDDHKVATFTNEKLSFWKNGVEIAYYANSQLYVTDAVIVHSMKIGNYSFIKFSNGSFGIQYTP